MKIEVAKNAGFCFGVSGAVREAGEILEKNDTVYATGDIVHNPSVMRELEAKGLVVVGSAAEIPEGAHFIIRAHGEPPESYEIANNRNLIIHDATCSYVKNIHKLVKRIHDEGKRVVIFGSADHPEIIGVNGYCGNCALIIENAKQAEEIDEDGRRLCLIAQTTANLDDYEEIYEILKERFPNIEKFDTICKATQKRQLETVEMAKKADIMIVVGGRNSSNTRKLFEICRRHCVKTYWVEEASELSPDIAIGCNYIGITAGASTPDRIVKEVLEYMSEEVKQGSTTEFERALEESLVELRNGQLVKGKVISLNDQEVFLDVGYKIDGTINIDEFPKDADGKPKVKEGDEVEAIVSKVKDAEGIVYLSKRRADERKAFDKVNKLFEDNETFKAKVKEVVKGGLILDVFGVNGFMPASLVSDRFVRNLNKYVGRKLKVKIIENDRRRKKLILSAKAVIEEENERLEKEVWSKLEIGSVINGRIKSLTNFGAFVDVGGIDGLLHITEMSWTKIDHPSDMFEVGQDVVVYVKDFDREEKKISLGYKREEDNPWYDAEEKYASGNIVKAKVVRILPFGAFVNLEEGIDALVHISQISNKRLGTPDEVLKEGMEVEVAIVDVDIEKRKINASIKAVEPMDPEPTEDEKTEVGEESSTGPSEKKTGKPSTTKRRKSTRSKDRLATSHREDFNNTLGDLLSGLDIETEEDEEVGEAEETTDEEVSEDKAE